MSNYEKTQSMVMMAVFTAIIIIMAFVPFLGYIPLGFMNATIIHVPVIIGAIILGPKKGAYLGLIFGFTSLWKNTFMPGPTSFVFSPFITIAGFGGNMWSLVICLVPRTCIGVAAYYIYKYVAKGLKEKNKKSGLALVVAGVVGSLTNTLLVMNGIFLFFGDEYASASNKAVKGLYLMILSIIGTVGVPEAIVAGILTGTVGGILVKYSKAT